MPLTESQTRYVNFYTDFAFNKLFGTEANKDLLLSFLNSKFEGKEQYLDITYLNTEHLGVSADERKAIFNRLFEIAEIAKYTPEDRQDYEESLKNFRNWYSVIRTAEKKGHREGLEEGMEKGMKKGHREGLEEGMELGANKEKLANARNLKANGVSVELIAKSLNLTADEINAL